ncbi:MAG: cation:proton antiporter [Patescibacteria group bacterium]
MDSLFFTITFILALSGFFNFLYKKTGISSVVYLIIAGLIIGLPGIQEFIIGENLKEIDLLGYFALPALMFLAGLESSWRELYEEKKDALAIAITATLFPFFIGFCVFTLLGFEPLTSAIMGISMSIAAEATKARVLIELKKLKTRVGAALMGAGIIDDLIGLTIFLLITFWLGNLELKENSLLITAVLAFLAGLIFHKIWGRDKKFIRRTEAFLLYFLAPFFFISMGLNLEISSLILNPYLLALIIILAPSATIAGTMMAKFFTNLSWKQLYLIGWGMNSRGAIGLALAFVAFKEEFITKELYSSLVIMAIPTTIVFPFILKKTIARNPKIMN